MQFFAIVFRNKRRFLLMEQNKQSTRQQLLKFVKRIKNIKQYTERPKKKVATL